MAGDLNPESVRVLHAVAELVRARPRIESAPLQFRLYCFPVPVRDRVADVVDVGLAFHLRLAGDDRAVAADHVALLSVILLHVEAQQVDVEVAGFGVIRHAEGQMVDGRGFEALAGRRGSRSGRRYRSRGRNRESLDQLTSADAPGLELIDHARDDVFHD